MESKDAYRLRSTIALLRITLGVILLVTWWENLQKGLYQSNSFAGFINSLAAGHPIAAYRTFLTNVVAANATIFATFQLITELGMGLALVLGFLTPLAGLGATVFFLNLFLAYLNPNTGEWIWTYVLLVVAALVVTLTRSGRAWGIDRRLVKQRGRPPFGLLW
jgi:thiosulfate dehydrogenase [quinone] large subunit